MKKYHSLILFIIYPFILKGQYNLVLNPDFELHKSCKLYSGSIHPNEDSSLVYNWLGASNIGTSDYYNSCSEDPVWYNIPLSTLNYQLDYNGKNGYALIFVTGVSKWNNNKSLKDFREYIQTKFNIALKRQKYCVGAYTNICVKENSGIIYAPFRVVAIKDIGIYLSKERPFNDGKDTANPYLINANPQIVSNKYLQDTVNWELVSGVYNAQGDENWLTIGNFKPEWKTDYITLINNTDSHGLIAYLIDHVFAIPMEDGGLLENDTTVCASAFPMKLKAADGLDKYIWNTGDTLQNITINNPGTYFVKSSKYGCEIIDTIHIKYNTNTTIVEKQNDTVICKKNLPFEYIYKNKSSLKDIIWSDGNIGEKIIVNSGGEKILIAKNNCDEEWRDTINFKIEEPIEVKILKDNDLCKDGHIESIVLSNEFPLEKYLWSNGSKQSKIIINNPGMYILSSTNSCGSFKDEILIKGCESKVYVPNIFYPEESVDNENAIFRPYFSNAELIDIEIFDRWGGLIYKDQGKNGKWNGVSGGKMCQDGIYIYKIKYIDFFTNEIKFISGDVFIVH